ncbi:MAG: hypothetical protein CME61_03615 [Halobacteriovoraceae bacterium]|nr:hypothetical protein [Halobacteriovoraceae bacterium]|tara:strand:+ start:454 stop:669 length:216 start_codon:yes stop_codon:yes gene_type:complete
MTSKNNSPETINSSQTSVEELNLREISKIKKSKIRSFSIRPITSMKKPTLKVRSLRHSRFSKLSTELTDEV